MLPGAGAITSDGEFAVTDEYDPDDRDGCEAIIKSTMVTAGAIAALTSKSVTVNKVGAPERLNAAGFSGGASRCRTTMS